MSNVRFSASLSFLFQELPFLERFRAAKESGFEGVEFSVPYDFDPKEIGLQLKKAAVECVVLGAPAGDAKLGEKGIAALPHRKCTIYFMKGGLSGRCGLSDFMSTLATPSTKSTLST